MAKRVWNLNSTKYIVKNKRLGTQSYRILMKFGGPSNFHTLAREVGEKIDKKSVYRWLYPKLQGGTGGLIPINQWELIFRVAKFTGIFISSSDCDPRSTPMDELELLRERPRISKTENEKILHHDLEKES